MNTLVQPTGTARRPRLSLWFLRVATTVHLVLVLAQPVLAGLFLTGDVDAITVHGTVGSALAAVSLVQIGLTLVYVFRRGRLWVLPVVVALFLAVGAQIGLGFSRVLEVHVPLGVAIATASVLLAVWVWSPSAARPRGGAR
ncbi:hypothetical protein [Actinophytocola algeriensis]|uniref:Uncharacterized protein n=1 Tax=Actinophytocola algeriensis TaxID=1768010 RepID=A0A7W7Q959_9PSEU|nr:hypothetical protein [Actinophytocola algeriensis]MBB4909309.1 hypothetical protein [Actinophytocola algeriensis]MBE1475299.1 hypothetical protein [Actinophytocola algeriensis]